MIHNPRTENGSGEQGQLPERRTYAFWRSILEVLEVKDETFTVLIPKSDEVKGDEVHVTAILNIT